MSIVARCPHCETRFTLQPEMGGKSMRCPNLECRQVFTVHAQEATAPPPELPPEPKAPPRPPKPAAKPPKPAVVEATVVDAAVVAPPKVKEVVWSEGTDVPPKKEKGKKKPLQAEAADDDFIVRRRKKRNRGPLVLIGMVVLVVMLLGGVGLYVLRNQGQNEERLAAQAKDEYGQGDYGAAAKTYDTLAKEYPGSGKADEYTFFADLANMQTVVRSVTNREDYEPAVARLKAFIDAHKESPLARPKSGHGGEVLEAGKKLGEDIANHAGDRVTAYQANRANSDELAKADKAVAAGRELLAALDPFRGPDDPPLDKLRAAFDQVEKEVKRERDRTAALARAKAQLEKPTDAVIQAVEADLKAAGFLEDDEAKKLVADAKGRLLELVRYEDDPAAPPPPPPSAAASLLFVTPVGKTVARERAAGDPPPAVFLCVARGILYALDEDGGALLWAARVGPDVTDPPAVARVPLAAGPTDVAVVTSNVGSAPAVSGYVLKTGFQQWYQPLPAAAAGPAVVVGGRAFVPLRDAAGTVYEFDLATGNRVGRICLGQPAAEKGAVLRPGTSLLYVAAEARRVYVIDAGGRNDDGNRVNPRCVQVVATDHLAGTVRVPPLFVGPGGTEPAERWMVLAQADGPAVTKLRAFAVGPIAAPADGATVLETPAVPVAALPVPGWVWFPPACDGERLAVVSDSGQLRLFGVNQPGNFDKPLFPLPLPAPPLPTSERPVRGLVIPVEESTYWVLAAGQLRKARLALVANKGQEVVTAGAPRNVGEPLHAAQFGARKDVACIAVRTPNSSGCRAVLFDLHTGEARWQRQLGLVPAKVSSGEQFAPPVAQGDSFVLVDENGGIAVVPAASGVSAGQTRAAPAAWVVAAAPDGATGPTVTAATADGALVYAVTPVARASGPKFVVRRVAGGKLIGAADSPDEVNAPAALAGQPAVVGGALLIPTDDGFVNRFVPGTGPARPAALVPGPKWWGDRKPADAVCSITRLSDSSFATSDGGKQVSRWEWPAGGASFAAAGSWELRDAVAGPGVVVPPAEPGGPPRLAVADASGSVWLFAADRAGPPLKRWKAGGEGALPAGRPSSALAAQPADAAHTAVAYVVDGKWAAAIDPDRDDPLWAVRTTDAAGITVVGAPQSAGGNRWVVTDLAGRVVLIDGTTGEVVATRTAGLPGAVPAAASAVAADTALTPLSDGSAVVIELPKK